MSFVDFGALPPAPVPMCEATAHIWSATANTTITRFADENEAAVILKLFIENLCPIAHFPPHIPSMADEIFRLIQVRQLFVATRDGEIVGCAAFVVSRPWYLDVEQMWDQGVFVTLKHRKGPAAYRLRQALINESERRGLTLIFCANTKNQEAAPVMAKRHKKIGEIFVLRRA